MRADMVRVCTVPQPRLCLGLLLQPLLGSLMVGLAWCSDGPPSGPIRVGVLAPLVGPFATAGQEIVEGARLYREERQGQIAGRKIELLVEDTAGRPDVGLTKAQKLVERDGAHVLVGVVSSAVAYALRDYVTERKVPLLISGFAVAERLTMDEGSPYVFRVTTGATQPSSALARWVHERLGARRAVIVADDSVGTVEVAMGFARSFAQKGGQIVQELYAPLGTMDYAPFLARIRKDADVVASMVTSPAFARQYQEFGLQGTIRLIDIHQGFTQPHLLPAAGRAAVGVATATSYVHSIDSEENRKFVRAYHERYGRLPGFAAESTYLALTLLEKVLETGAAERTPRFLEVLAKTEVRAPRGLVRFDGFRNPVQNVFIVRIVEKEGRPYPEVVETVPNVSQFGPWSPEEYLRLPRLRDLKGTWTR